MHISTFSVLPQLHLALEDAMDNKCLNIVFLLTEVNILLLQ